MKITDHDRITDINDDDVMLVDGKRGTKIASILTFINKVLGKLPISIPVPIASGGTGATTAALARTALGIGAAGTMATPIPVNRGGTGATTAAAARTALGLGAAAILTSPIPLKNGGTGATAAAAARTNLGLGAASTYGVTTSVTSGSTALVTSGGVYTYVNGKTISNPVRYAYVYTGNTLSFTPSGSNSMSLVFRNESNLYFVWKSASDINVTEIYHKSGTGTLSFSLSGNTITAKGSTTNQHICAFYM